MKIDRRHPASDTQATNGTRRAGTDESVRKGGTVASFTSSPDRVELPGDAALLTAARKAAEAGPGIRSDRVEQMRQKLHAGKVGTDAGKLADAILDDLCIATQYEVSQPLPYLKGQTQVVPQTNVKIEENQAQMVNLDVRATLGEVVLALNMLGGATPRDIIVIMQSLKAAGALRAELVIL